MIRSSNDLFFVKVEDHISILGSGSDHATFAFYAGIPSAYFSLGKNGNIIN
jgi:hypothetical protein